MFRGTDCRGESGIAGKLDWNMELVTNRTDGILVVEAWSRVDGTNAREFESAVSDALSDEDSALLLDFGPLTYISSAGLRVILLTARELKRRNAGFALCSLAAPIEEVFAISGFDRIVSIHESRDKALAALAR